MLIRDVMTGLSLLDVHTSPEIAKSNFSPQTLSEILRLLLALPYFLCADYVLQVLVQFLQDRKQEIEGGQGSLQIAASSKHRGQTVRNRRFWRYI
jgi:hypothetical protein